MKLYSDLKDFVLDCGERKLEVKLGPGEPVCT